MFNSVRTRLTLWYSGVLALVLVLFAFATYSFLAAQIRQLTEENLRELAGGFVNTVEREYTDTEDDDEETARTKSEKINDAIGEAADELRLRDYQIFVFDREGKSIVASKDFLNKYHLSASDLPKDSETFSEFTDDENHSFRIFAEKFSPGGEIYRLLVAYSLKDQSEFLRKVKTTFSIIVPLALLLASFGGYFLARKSLSPVVAMSETASQISAKNLHNERLAVGNEHDELGKLARSFNDLLQRLDDAFTNQRRFMADASHELRTPIAIVRGESEVTLSKKTRTPEDYRESFAIVQAESKRMTVLVEDLFTLARADAGQVSLIKKDFYLDELLQECVRAVKSLAEKREISITLEAETEMPFHADEELLRRLFLNLLDNAIKFTPPKGLVKIHAGVEENFYSVTVSDTGNGISTDDQPHIFERFYRADKARSRDENESGAGLGLSIALWISEAHEGTLVLQKSDTSSSTFLVKLPVK